MGTLLHTIWISTWQSIGRGFIQNSLLHFFGGGGGLHLLRMTVDVKTIYFDRKINTNHFKSIMLSEESVEFF